MFQEEIFASSFAAAAYLKSIDFPKEKKVYGQPFLGLAIFFLTGNFVPVACNSALVL